MGQILFQINRMNEQRQEEWLGWKMVGFDGRPLVKTVQAGFDRRLGDKTEDCWLIWWTGAKKRTGAGGCDGGMVANMVDRGEEEDWWLRRRTGG